MTDCTNIEIGKLTGKGESGNFAKAVRKAAKDFQRQGRSACLPGSCGQFGGKCSFKINESSVSIDVKVVGSGAQTDYWVEISGTGECSCN